MKGGKSNGSIRNCDQSNLERKVRKDIIVIEMVLYEKWGRDSYFLKFLDLATESNDPFWKSDPINVSAEKRVPYSKYWLYWELNIETIQRREKHNHFIVTESFFGNSQQRTNHSFIHEVLNTQNILIF